MELDPEGVTTRVTGDLGYGDLRPRTWLDAFPWLKGAADAAGYPWWDEPIDEAGGVVRQQRIAMIAELAMARLSQWTIGQIFPGLSPETELLQLRMPVRALNALGRNGCLTGADLMGVSLRVVMAWKTSASAPSTPSFRRWRTYRRRCRLRR